VPTLPKGWVEHTHLEGKLFYVRDGSNRIQGTPRTLTIVTDVNPLDSQNLRGLESVHRQVVEAISDEDMRRLNKVQLFVDLCQEEDGWVGRYYLADLDNQSIFWYETLLQYSPFHISLFALGWRKSIRRNSAVVATKLILAPLESST